MLRAAANDFEKPYLDSSIFFAIIKKETELCSSGLMRWQVAERILRYAERGQYQIHTSTITLAEVRRIRERSVELTQEELTTVARFFRHEYIRLAAVTREIAERAQFWARDTAFCLWTRYTWQPPFSCDATSYWCGTRDSRQSFGAGLLKASEW